MKGATVVMEQMFEPGMVLENIEKFHVTSMFGVPAMYLFMAQHPDFATRDLSSIRVLSCGGAPVPEALIKIYAARGLPFNQGYGLTETAPFASFLPSSMATEKLGSAGIAPFFTDVKIVDDDGHDVPDGERGEIVVRGPNVMKGYWNRPDATAEVLVDGWFHTGDVGHPRRRRLLLHRRSQEGHDHQRRRERVSRPRSRTRSTSIPASRRSRSSACRIRAGVRRCARSWCRRTACHSPSRT